MNAPLLPSGLMTQLEAMALHWERTFRGQTGGQNRSSLAGQGHEFLDHRNFHSGDDVRAVNWRAYLRFERYFLRTFQFQPRVPVRILLDTSGSIASGGKVQYALTLAAALTYLALVRLESVTLQPFDQNLRHPLTVSGGKHRYQPAEEFLRGLQFTGCTDFKQLPREVSARYPQKGALIILSDFFDRNGESVDAVESLGYIGHDVIAMQLWSEDERTPPLSGDLLLIDAESGEQRNVAAGSHALREYTERFDAHADALARAVKRHRGRYVSVPVTMAFSEVLFGPANVAVAAR